MKENKFSNEDINPWTFRIRESSYEDRQQVNKNISSIKQKIYTQSIKDKVEQTAYSEMKFRCFDRLSKLPKYDEKKIAETYQTIDKIRNKFQNCKKISIQFGHPTKAKEDKKRKSPLQGNIKQLYIMQTEPFICQQKKLNAKNNSMLKIKRYFTQQKEIQNFDLREKLLNFKKIGENIQQKSSDVQSKSALYNISRTEHIKGKNDPVIRLRNISERGHISTKIIVKGRIYDEISNMWALKGDVNVRLGLMKRSYNLKKLQRILRQQLSAETTQS